METNEKNTAPTFNYTVKQICEAYDKLFEKKKRKRLETSNGN